MAFGGKWKIYLILLGGLLASPGNTLATYSFEDAEKEGDLTLVEVVEGFAGSLPCSIQSPPMTDAPVLTLWYIGNQETPVYSYDQRDPRKKSVDWSDTNIFGGEGRAKYLPLEHPPVLRLNNVTTRDDNLYRCRVDYHNSNSRQAWVKLTVIVPPTEIKIFTRSSPVDIGERNDVECRAYGGYPLANVEWFQEGKEVDVKFVVNEKGTFSRNSLDVAASRKDLSKPFTCKANNNKFTPPLQTTYLRNVTCGPLSVKIVPEETPIVAGRQVKLVCSVIGSNPQPIVTWYEQAQEVMPLHTQVQVSENLTVSELTLEASRRHHGSQMVCRAEHPTLIPSVILEDIYTLDIQYKPKVHLSLGRGLDPADLKEGIDLFFECFVDSNPPPYKITWYHQGKELLHNVSAGVLVSEATLALQHVQRQSSGKYSCKASNVEGDSHSNQLNISVKYSPRCMVDPSLRGVALMEPTEFVCDVEGDPGKVSFRWTFNNSVRREKSQVMNITSYTQEGQRSVLRYTPMSERDFGTLLCFADNEVGQQKEPCSFTIISAGPPEEVDNCTEGNVTSHSVGISCLPGFDGGLPQRFLIQVKRLETNEVVLNYTSNVPVFIAKPLDPGHIFKVRIVAYNTRGVSKPKGMIIQTLKKAEMHKSLPSKVEPSPLVLINGVIVGMVGVTAIIFLAVVWRVKTNNTTRNNDSKRGSSTSNLTQVVLKDNNPDVIGGGASQSGPLNEDIKSMKDNEGFTSCSIDEGRQTSGQMYDDSSIAYYGSSSEETEISRLHSNSSSLNSGGVGSGIGPGERLEVGLVGVGVGGVHEKGVKGRLEIGLGVAEVLQSEGGGSGGGGGCVGEGVFSSSTNLLLAENEIHKDPLSSSSSSSSSVSSSPCPPASSSSKKSKGRDLRRQTLVRLLNTSSPTEAYF